MIICFPIGFRLVLALVAAVLAVGAAQAQFYSYETAAPEPSPNTISNAARSPSVSPTAAMGLGGDYVPTSLTARDIGSRLPRRQFIDPSKAHIWLRLPEKSQVWVNGVKTKQSGESRYFYSPPLTPGKKYSYEMRVRWQKEGKVVEETQYLIVQAGAKIERDFTHLDKTDTNP